MRMARRLAGMVALVSYLVMGAMLYFTVLPGANGHWPPDFHLRGYDVEDVSPFVRDLADEARATYGVILQGWDLVFILSLAAWLALMGWRGGGLRYVVVGLAALYAGVDLAENAAIHRFAVEGPMTPALVQAANHLTMAKFASLYLCVLVLIWHLRRSA